MTRMFAIAATVLLLAVGCGGDDDGSTDSTTTTAGDALPAWLTGLGQDLPADVHADGDLYVSDSAETVYAEDCDDARSATGEGGKYGPEPRNADGSGGAAGYAFVCP